ncbi:mammalian cell entry protein [Mycobacterium numidiamassiliense]|uniref:mammalian cell entry protein n=1 Tax=Mycobacterium numidiamassiliense TaxID=1841861 RepID=UPI003CCBB1E0
MADLPAAAAGGESPSTAIEDVTPAASDVASDEAPEAPAASDVASDEAPGEPASSDETVDAATTAASETADTEVTADAGEADPEAPEATKTRRRLLTGKWAGVVAAAAAVLFVGSAAFAGATLQPYLTDRATAATKLKVAQTAANAITTLWTYTPENMDKLADRASGYLSGDFEAQYRKFVDAIVGPNKQAKITNSTQVTGAAVESLDGPDAVVIVYTNTTSTSPLNKNIPSLKYLSYRLFMKRANGHWLVTRMTTVTSLDLTPHV